MTKRPKSARKPYSAATRETVKRITIPLEPEDHRWLKILAASSCRSIEDIVREAVNQVLVKEAR